MSYKKLSVMVAVLMTVSLILSACATPTAEVVEKVVTQEVEKVVTRRWRRWSRPPQLRLFPKALSWSVCGRSPRA